MQSNEVLLILNAVICNLMELTARSTSLAFAVSDVKIGVCVFIPYVPGPKYLCISVVLHLQSVVAER